MSVLSSVQILKTKSQRSKLGNVKLQSSKYKESVKTVKISIINTQLTLNKVMYTTYVWIMSKTATC